MTTQSYTYFLDLATSPDRVQVVGVSAGGMECMRRLLPFFAAYKYYKLGHVKLKVVPASTLPVDPTGLSYEAGENTVDPRDQFNPGLVRITNGEDIVVPTTMDQYYSLMLDRRWFKFNLQSGFSRDAVPRVWRIAQLHHIVSQVTLRTSHLYVILIEKFTIVRDLLTQQILQLSIILP